MEFESSMGTVWIQFPTCFMHVSYQCGPSSICFSNLFCHPKNRIKPIHLNEALSASPASPTPARVDPPPSPQQKLSDDAMSVYLFLVNPSVKLPLSCGGQGTDSTSWFVGPQGRDSPSLLRSIWHGVDWSWPLLRLTKDELGLIVVGGVS